MIDVYEEDNLSPEQVPFSYFFFLSKHKCVRRTADERAGISLVVITKIIRADFLDAEILSV